MLDFCVAGIDQLCQHSSRLPLAVIHPRMERIFPLKTQQFFSLKACWRRIWRGLCFFFSTQWLRGSIAPQSSGGTQRLLHQEHSRPLSWLFAALGCSPASSHPLLGCCSFSLGLVLLEQRSRLTIYQLIKYRVFPWSLSSDEHTFQIPLSLVFPPPHLTGIWT